MKNRRAQLESVALGPGIEFDFRGVKAGPALLDCYHDYVMGDIALFEAGLSAEEDGYDAVCIDTMSDSGMNALRSVLDIPVIGPGRASYMTALMLGNRFSVVTQWDGWVPLYKKSSAGIRRRRQARLDPLHQRDARRGEPARRQGGGGLPQAGGLRHALHRGGRAPR